MPPHIELRINLNEELGITSVLIMHNDTGLKSDSILISKVSEALIKAVDINKNDCKLQDMLQDFDISIKNDLPRSK